MRGAAAHIDIYKLYLESLRPEAIELIADYEKAVIALSVLVSTLKKAKRSPTRARELASAVNEAEYEADYIMARAERGLVPNSPPRTHLLLAASLWPILLRQVVAALCTA